MGDGKKAIDAITERIQSEIKKSGTAVETSETDSEDEENNEDETEKLARKVLKRPATALVAMPATSAKKVQKKTPSGGAEKAHTPDPKLVEKWLKKVQKHLPFKGAKNQPMYYKCITIYSHKNRFRVKPGLGRRDEKIIAFTNKESARLAWPTVQKRAAEYLAVEA